MDKRKRIINREISWLSFNHRVLQEADDPNTPLIERLRFLGIFSNNLDEFFKVRVATIKRMIDLKINPLKYTGEKPRVILNEIQETVVELQVQFGEIYENLLRELEKEKIFIINENQLTNKVHADFVKEYFKEQVDPILRVVMLHNISEFPYLKDKFIYLATKLSYSEDAQEADYALIEIPSSLPRFLVLPQTDDSIHIMLLDDVIRHCLEDVFSIFNYKKFESYTIKLTRDAELDIDNDLTKSFLEKISQGVSTRSMGQPVRFLYDYTIPPDLLKFITTRLQFDRNDSIIPGGRYHNFKDFMKFPDCKRKDLLHPSFPPMNHKLFTNTKNMFDMIRKQDVMLHYPYHTFNHYIRLLRQAAIDPDVVEIKTTIYRVSESSKVVNALINAAINGKRVTANIELQARFDEESNIFWSKKLEEAGAKILFGIAGLKVHCKLAIIRRKEQGRIVDYACVGTGNFHEGTAKVYTDLMILTVDKRISNDVKKVFELFENTYQNFNFRHFLVSPLNQRRRLNQLIDNEIKNKKAGKNAYILLKINNLVDNDMIYKLYAANKQGVKITLIVRGMCSLIPGVKGLSENIEAVSIVDKYLEHARIFVFCNNNKEEVFISSADWMTRNLDNRIEVTCPVYNPKLKKEILDILQMQLKDNAKSRIITDKHDNQYRDAQKNKDSFRSQVEIYKYYDKKENS